MAEPDICARLTCGHEWDDHNHEGNGAVVRDQTEDCCTVKGCDCPIFIPEEWGE